MLLTRSRILIAASAGALVAGAVTTAGLSPAGASAPVGRTVHVHIGSAHAVHMPTVLRPGVHRFVVSSSGTSEFQLARKRAGYTDAELANDANAALGQGDIAALKRFENHMVFLGGVDTRHGHGGVVYVDLARGSYIALDTDDHGVMPSKIVHLRVTGRHLAGHAPAAPVIRATHAVSFAKKPASIARKGWLRFANSSSENHFAEIVRLAPGKTMADVRAWVNAAKSGQDVRPPVDQSVDMDTPVLSPGHSITWHYRLPAGHYVLICFWPDADMAGMPHAFMGMYRGLTVR